MFIDFSRIFRQLFSSERKSNISRTCEMSVEMHDFRRQPSYCLLGQPSRTQTLCFVISKKTRLWWIMRKCIGDKSHNNDINRVICDEKSTPTLKKRRTLFKTKRRTFTYCILVSLWHSFKDKLCFSFFISFKTCEQKAHIFCKFFYV